jgi:carbamate kinase
MLVVVALGGKALLRRGEPQTTDRQRANVRAAAKALAPIAAEHQLVIGHGSGPQVGMLALQGAAYAHVETYPIDVLGAQTEGSVGYLIEQELGNLLPVDRPFATLLTMVEVDPADPAFRTPATLVGPVYLREEAERLTSEKGWMFKSDGDKWRRVVASPEPRRTVELQPIKWLLEHHTIVIAAGGGGIPAVYEKTVDRRLRGAECVIDKDLASELLARELGADLFVMLTDTDAVFLDWGKPTQKAIRRGPPAALEALPLASGSMGPKVRAACRFARATSKTSAIGALADLSKIVSGEAGTTISTNETGIVYGASNTTGAQAGRSR